MSLYTIGQLARRTGLRARTIRFWSDTGVLPPARRSDGGYRLYDAEAVARLDLVRTLRDLGLGLDAVQQILQRRSTLREVAQAHVEALDAEIRTLRVQRAVLRVLARRDTTTEEMTLMNALARLSAQERQKIIDEFVDGVFAGVLDEDAALVAGWMRDLPSELPDDPTPEQVDAWVELAELVACAGFRQTVRRMVLSGDNRLEFGLDLRPLVLEHAGGALERGIAPESAAAVGVLERVVPADLPAAETAALISWLAMVAEPRVERYWQLLSVLGGRAPAPPAVPAFHWLRTALTVHRT
ncbi:DNA-binding transcriptional regulator, MerR family [Nonomuraea maritima]|uniref:DNA-binding transcriptional regulator, MerR family n=1 Tax=Nonomuraea maritima TaxID=683260 RepID=A0A1G9H5H9_9ACTN|nr:MerR family transcriptional regulator [Nonomuraea maritima]SDL08152.1 DNA-binding transcriptional regulator, MerR family [Nonomuraea maritima]